MIIIYGIMISITVLNTNMPLVIRKLHDNLGILLKIIGNLGI